MAYSDKVLDHYENPRNVGVLDKDDPNVGTGMVLRLLRLRWLQRWLREKPLMKSLQSRTLKL